MWCRCQRPRITFLALSRVLVLVAWHFQGPTGAQVTFALSFSSGFQAKDFPDYRYAVRFYSWLGWIMDDLYITMFCRQHLLGRFTLYNDCIHSKFFVAKLRERERAKIDYCIQEKILYV